MTGSWIKLACIDKEAFIKYTINEKFLPSSFSGKVYDPYTGIFVSKDMIGLLELKFVATKEGLMDSLIEMTSLEITEKIIGGEEIMPFDNADFARRPSMELFNVNGHSHESQLGSMRDPDNDILATPKTPLVFIPGSSRREIEVDGDIGSDCSVISSKSETEI